MQSFYFFIINDLELIKSGGKILNRAAADFLYYFNLESRDEISSDI